MAVPDPSGPRSPRYPATLEITYPSELNRWLPLIKWLLAVPHYIALFFVAVGAFFVMVYGFFAVLFTGRWGNAYAYFTADRYPPFAWG